MDWKYLFYILILGALTGNISCNKSKDIKIISYNIRYDNPGDPYKWEKRKDAIASIISKEAAGILCIQEALNHQNLELQELLPEYSWYGVGRDDGMNEGEYCSLFIRKDEFVQRDSGTFWLSETPAKPGPPGWDGACTRICSWVKLQADNAFSFFVFNAHYDHIGDSARLKSSELILHFIDSLAGDEPVILCGDFNAVPVHPAIQMIHSKLKDTFSEQAETTCTYNNFEYQFADCKRIDYVFTSEHFMQQSFQIIPPQKKQIIPSDHNPVIVKLVKK